MIHTRECFSQYMGLWAYEASRFRLVADAIRSGTMKPMAARAEAPTLYDEVGIEIQQGVAVLPLHGNLMKGWSKYGGTSTIAARQAMRQMETDKSVKAVVLHIDSPGGTVAGSQEVAASIERLGRAKPVLAHIDDIGASAAYWAATGARTINVNAMGMVGSIGVYGVVEDTSGAYEKAGVKAYLVSSGKFKGGGVDGVEVTKEQLAQVQKLVDSMHAGFVAQVERGRSQAMTAEQINSIADGRVFPAQEAKALGLVDGVQAFEDTFAQAVMLVENQRRESRIRSARLANA